MANPMPNPAESSQDDLYATVEAAYRNGDWKAVLEQGTVLNRRMARAAGANVQALRQRLELMLAHTHLYGFNDPESAQIHYQELLNQPLEASLRQMAEDGVKQCRDRLVATASGSDDQDTATADQREGEMALDSDQASDLTGSMAAEPWLEDLTAKSASADSTIPPATTGKSSNPSADRQSGTSAAAHDLDAAETLIPDVIDEPELLEIHQADPDLADEVVLNPQPKPLASLAEAAKAEVNGAEPGFDFNAAPAGEEPDPDLLACLRLVRLS
jgi:hypothetical protein